MPEGIKNNIYDLGEFRRRLTAKKGLTESEARDDLLAGGSNSPEGTAIASITPIVEALSKNHPTQKYLSEEAPIDDGVDQK